MTADRPTDVERVVLDAVSEALERLDAVAHAPIQGEAMHKVIAAHVLLELAEHGYTIERKQTVNDRAEGLL